MTAISEETYKAIGKPKLQTPDRILYGPAKQALDVLGQFTTTVSHHKHGSAYSRTEPESEKTGCQDLSPSARWPRTEFMCVYIVILNMCFKTDAN